MPQLLTFTLDYIVVEVKSETAAHRKYRVTFAHAKPPKCTCQGYARHRNCKHCRYASDYLFSESGLYQSLECVDAEIGALLAMPAIVNPYRHAALVGLRDEIQKRIDEIEPDDEYGPAPFQLAPAPQSMGGYDEALLDLNCPFAVPVRSFADYHRELAL